MKTIKHALKIRESIFDESKRDDTLDLANLTNNSIDADRFFEETFVTEGMKLLFETAFGRFEGKAGNGLVKLTQAMGGGKTHNMVALGVMAQNPHIREIVLGGKYKHFKAEVKVIAYTGRESNLDFGIWGEIAKQLGKEAKFAPYYSPLKAPGQSAWIELLKSETPTLILLDELPPYLEYCKTQTYGTGTLLDITTTALSNLFNALNKAELHNVCLIVSDLDAAYQQGSQVIRGIFDNLSNEMSRSSTNIEPVGANTDDLYSILRTRLFTKIASESEINEIAHAYQAAIKEASEMRLTDENPSEIAKGIRSSYPFHPSIRDLFARFKENSGFQQTRGFIRLSRAMVKGLFKEGGLAEKRYLINPYDIDLNDSEMVTIIKNIKSELSNAISHDVASEGKSIAEQMDAVTKSTDMQDATKLILMSSLSKVTGGVIGLTMNEIIAYIATPGRDITNLNKNLEDLKTRAWYLYSDGKCRLFFRKVQNVNAQLNDEIRGFTYDQAKLHIRELLREKFKPSVGDCYQEVLVFPSIQEIDIKKNKVALILTEPSKDNLGLHEDLLKFYEDASYKNRVMFLTGVRTAMDNLIDITKSYKAIENIIYKMEQEDKVDARDSELLQAKDLHKKISAKLFSNIRETFIVLHFPKKQGLVKKDFKMAFDGNNFNAEKQIRDVLLEEMKFINEIDPSKLKSKFEARVFTQQRMTWNHLMERAATETSWQWHLPKALDDLKSDCLRRGEWTEEGGYLDREPPAQSTAVHAIELNRDNESGEVTLKIVPTNGDIVYYEIDNEATTASAQIKDFTAFRTKELKLSFLCVDSTGENETGEQYGWINKVAIRYKPFDKDGKKYMELQATSPDVKIIYTTNGSNPANGGGTYLEPFEIPFTTKYVQAIAVNEEKGIYSEKFQYEIKDDKFVIDKTKPVFMDEPLMSTSSSETFKVFEGLKEVDTKIKGVDITVAEKGGINSGFMVLGFGDISIGNIDELIGQLNMLIDKFFVDKKYEVTATINNIVFNNGQAFEQWISNQKSTVDAYKNKIRQ